MRFEVFTIHVDLWQCFHSQKFHTHMHFHRRNESGSFHDWCRFYFTHWRHFEVPRLPMMSFTHNFTDEMSLKVSTIDLDFNLLTEGILKFQDCRWWVLHIQFHRRNDLEVSTIDTDFNLLAERILKFHDCRWSVLHTQFQSQNESWSSHDWCRFDFTHKRHFEVPHNFRKGWIFKLSTIHVDLWKCFTHRCFTHTISEPKWVLKFARLM